MKAKQMRRRAARTARADLRAVWRRLAARGDVKARMCGMCGACPREQPCAWREGLLADDHRPDLLGVVVDARILPGKDGAELVCTVVRETVADSGALALESVREIIRAFAVVTPVLVAEADGDVVETMNFPEGFQPL